MTISIIRPSWLLPAATKPTIRTIWVPRKSCCPQLKYGYLYQGQWYDWQKQRRGVPSLHAPKSAFVTFLENHDQVANSARGLRLHQLTSPGMLRAMTAFLILGPGVPMLFQGQEFASPSPFQFFADMPESLDESGS